MSEVEREYIRSVDEEILKAVRKTPKGRELLAAADARTTRNWMEKELALRFLGGAIDSPAPGQFDRPNQKLREVSA